MTKMNSPEVQIAHAVGQFYGDPSLSGKIQLQKTKREFNGDTTLVVFPLIKISKKSPEETAREIGDYLKGELPWIKGFNTVKGFLNIEFTDRYWIERFNSMVVGSLLPDKKEKPGTYVIEFSSPNTNKPLHLGHIRNNLLGYSLAMILEANGNEVHKVNIVNDRGIHICKSMLAWKKSGKQETPGKSGIKGDHLVGNYYVLFEKWYRDQVAELVSQGRSEEEARREAPVILEAQELLRKWEDGDRETLELWRTMNQWVYNGFDQTYKELGVHFDRIYYESQTYMLGRTLVQEALEKGVFFKKEDGSVWIDLTDEGLDSKLLLRADGTSVYMTQDLGTAHQRYNDFRFDSHIYIVGNEQNYHFQVLFKILNNMGFSWAKNLYHLSYGMVELPEGKMKSREGKVVDADDLMKEMHKTAMEMSVELGKLDGYDDNEKEEIIRMIGMAALKYFILKVDPKKNMTFNPIESVDFNGNTGPFIQYTYARIQSIKRNAYEKGITQPERVAGSVVLNEKERSLIRESARYKAVVEEAGETMNPSLIANYIYELVKEYNQFYHDHSILSEPDESKSALRMILSEHIGKVIRAGVSLLGIEVPPRM